MKHAARILMLSFVVSGCTADFVVLGGGGSNVSPLSSPPGGACTNPNPNGPFGGGTGTAADPYVICSAAQLNAIGLNPASWNSNFQLAADIDLSAYDSSTAAPFTRIGSFDTAAGTGSPFTGNFDGKNHHVAGLKIVESTAHSTGLFSFTQGASIQNLILDGAMVTGTAQVGILIGLARNTQVTNVQVNGIVQGMGDTQGIAGLIGVIQGATASDVTSIQSSTANANVTGWDCVAILVGSAMLDGSSSLTITATSVGGTITPTSTFFGNTFGGLVGYLRMTTGATSVISKSFSTADVTTNGAFSGGFIGTVMVQSGGTSTISHSYSTGKFVTNATFAWHNGMLSGGFAGTLGGDAGSIAIDHSYSTGSVYDAHGGIGLGGFVGNIGLTTSGTISISESYSTSTVTSDADGSQGVGGFVGSMGTNGTATIAIENSYYRGTLNLKNNNQHVGGFAGNSVASIDKSYASATINVGATNVDFGGFIGLNGSSASNSYWNSDLVATGIGTNSGAVTVTGLAAAAFHSPASFAGWDFLSVWQMAASGFPGLQ